MNIDNIKITSKLIVIVGPTASGKTALSINLAQKLNCEIINGDAFQVYKKMDIGTGKITEEEKQGIKHHLLDIVDYQTDFSVNEYQKLAREIINNKLANDEYIIVVGGSNLYVDSILYNYEFNDNLQFNLLKAEYENYNLTQLQQIIDKFNITLNHSEYNNHKRLVNVICKLKLNLPIANEKQKENYSDYQLIGITVEREKLYSKINNRVLTMFEDGLIDEVKKFDKQYKSQQAIGYKEVHKFLNNELSFEDTIALVQQKSRNYAKRQISWYKKNDKVEWYTLQNDIYVKQLF